MVIPMNYKLAIFGVKDTTEEIVEFIHNKIRKIDVIITIHPDVLKGNHVAGFKGLKIFEEKYGIRVFEARSYSLNDEETVAFFKENNFDIGISMGWQRLIPGQVLNAFSKGVFGFHGSCGYLPYGRGRSPLNWSVINGDSRFILNLFRYDEAADSPNVFANRMFAITEHDTIRTLQYKNLLVSKQLITQLLQAYEQGTISVDTTSADPDSWYGKRTAQDGKINFMDKTRVIYNLIRGVGKPFPGAFVYREEEKIIIWEAHPFDEMLDFSSYKPGQVIDVFDGKAIVRTIDGSLLLDAYEALTSLKPVDLLH